jgi:hypothetical protein
LKGSLLVDITNQTQNEKFTSIISRIMLVEDITWGDPKQGYLVRYRGRIYNEDTATAYDQLADTFKPMGVTPLFREQGDQHVVILVSGVLQAKPSASWVNIVLFVFTVITVIMAGALYSFEFTGPAPSDMSGWIQLIVSALPSGIPFAVSLLSILLAHEFGHY